MLRNAHSRWFHTSRNEFVLMCCRALEREVSKIKDMQTHGTIRRAVQGTSDGDRLLGVYRCIKDILDDLQVGFSSLSDPLGSD